MDRRILVVDDSELICQQLSQLLSHPDRQSHDRDRRYGRCLNGWLNTLARLVLTDLQLPGISGLDLIRRDP